MAKSNRRTQRPQRTSRTSSKADVETTAQPNDNVETVEDPQAEQADAVKDDSLEGELLDLDDGDDKSDVVPADSDADSDGDGSADSDGDGSEAQSADDADADDKAAAAADDSEKSEKAAQSEKAAAADKDSLGKDEDGKDSKSSKKSETAKGASAKSSAAKGSAVAKGSSAKRTSRSGNPAKRSQGRKTATYTSQSGQQTIKPNPSWFLPVLIGLLLIGLVWLVTFYVSQGAFPVEAWANWNILIGFGFFVAGLIMSTRWR